MYGPKVSIRSTVRGLIRKAGYDLISLSRPPAESFPHDLTQDERSIYMAVRPYTVTTLERVVSLCRAVRHVVEHNIPGDFVECGVYMGGSALAIALVLRQLGVKDRSLYLYDTFEGRLPSGTAKDGKFAEEAYRAQAAGALKVNNDEVAMTALNRVRATLLSSGYPERKLVFVEGKVEDTIPGEVPERIALLRLDTDLYASTRHELEHLYPRLSTGGILIIDDYGSPAWPGSAEATDEYFAGGGPFISRIDADARLAVKP